MLVNGVDLLGGGSGSFNSATHGQAELKETVEALRNTIRMLRQEGEI